MKRSLDFYRNVMGIEPEAADHGVARLGVGMSDAPLVELREVPGIGRAPRQAAGLYHFAILLPDRADLARFARHLIENDVQFGQADHAVSEALYFDDPDGNGIEVYADRPSDAWPMDGGKVRMTADPIDFQDLFSTLQGDEDRWQGMPPGTTIGHVHLRVSDLERSGDFYVNRLGFDLMQDNYRGALFVSAGGYHHHLGMNIWESRGRAIAGDDVAGLDSFTIELPDRESWESSVRRLGGAPTDDGTFRASDPDGIQFDLIHSG